MAFSSLRPAARSGGDSSHSASSGTSASGTSGTGASATSGTGPSGETD